MGDDCGDELPGQSGSGLVALGLGQVALQDGLRRAQAEVGLEDRRKREPASRPPSALLVSLRRHRR
jgi:hypothetical protein